MEPEIIDFVELVNEAHELKLLKRFLLEKLRNYRGIQHEELRSICVMFGICEEGECE